MEDLFVPAYAVPVTPDTFLRVTVYSDVTDATIALRGRMMKRDGSIIPFSDVYTLANIGEKESFFTRLGAGWLIGVGVQSDASLQGRGQMYVAVQLQQGGSTANVPFHTIAADYLSAAIATSWPGARIRSSSEGPGLYELVDAGDTATGAEFAITVAENTKIRIVALHATLDAAAGGSDRYPHLIVLRSTDTLFVADVTEGLNEGDTAIYTWAEGLQTNNDDDGYFAVSIPSNLWLKDGDQIRSLTTNLDGSDRWTSVTLYQERLFEDDSFSSTGA